MGAPSNILEQKKGGDSEGENWLEKESQMPIRFEGGKTKDRGRDFQKKQSSGQWGFINDFFDFEKKTKNRGRVNALGKLGGKSRKKGM